MKLPKNMPKSEEPSFILAEKIWVQYFVILLLPLLALSVGHIFYILPSDRIFSKFLLTGVFILLFAILFSPKMWRRWVIFAADKNGVFFRIDWTVFQNKDFYMFVPWENVGESTIGIISIADNVRGVELHLKMTDEEWDKLAGKLPPSLSFLWQNKYENDCRKYPVMGCYYNPKKIREEIEKIRSAWRASKT